MVELGRGYEVIVSALVAIVSTYFVTEGWHTNNTVVLALGMVGFFLILSLLVLYSFGLIFKREEV
jgi:hypothetical protein